ncbi:MAG: 16S rRNA (cytosine(967)-C(5))-methyltransferase RsmB [Clostridia bacterium]|nr:16S rRNA (cytosine(967)-C(5))-methyltransferase RsmB [Clostridia bacterium]
MTKPVNTREIVLETLLESTNDEKQIQTNTLLRNVLDKYQYLDQKDRAFIHKIVTGTTEYRIYLDYVIEQFSTVKINKMKPVIRTLLRMSVYQLLFMDGVPSSAVCNEAVKLAEKKKFFNLKGFVNGVLRNIDRKRTEIKMPDAKKEPLLYLSIKYSMPLWIVTEFSKQYGYAHTEQILKAFLKERPTIIRANRSRVTKEELIHKLETEGVHVSLIEDVEEAMIISGYDHVGAIEAFREGLFLVQDLSSVLVGRIAAVKKQDYVVDVCAAPGGKSLHIADLLNGTGCVDARDLTQKKVDLINENIRRCQFKNIKTSCHPAQETDDTLIEQADIVIADLPCSGLGVIGRKSDIKYHISKEKQAEIVSLQRSILHTVQAYVKPGGTLIFSTCTMSRAENQDNLKWVLENYPYQSESLEPYLPARFHNSDTKNGYLQLLPGDFDTDGFFMARIKKM